MTYTSLIKASEITGVKVTNNLGENLGEINDIVINQTEGKISYLVLDFGGILGFGNKFFAVPWHVFIYDLKNNCFLLNVDKDHLKRAPGFEKNKWPNFADPLLIASIDKHYQ